MLFVNVMLVFIILKKKDETAEVGPLVGCIIHIFIYYFHSTVHTTFALTVPLIFARDLIE